MLNQVSKDKKGRFLAYTLVFVVLSAFFFATMCVVRGTKHNRGIATGSALCTIAAIIIVWKHDFMCDDFKKVSKKEIVKESSTFLVGWAIKATVFYLIFLR